MVFTRDGDGFVGGEVKEGVVRERASNSSETWKGENFGARGSGRKGKGRHVRHAVACDCLRTRDEGTAFRRLADNYRTEGDVRKQPPSSLGTAVKSQFTVSVLGYHEQST